MAPATAHLPTRAEQTVWGFGGNNEESTSSSAGKDIVYDADDKASQLVEMGKVLLEAVLKLDPASLPKRT